MKINRLKTLHDAIFISRIEDILFYHQVISKWLQCVIYTPNPVYYGWEVLLYYNLVMLNKTWESVGAQSHPYSQTFTKYTAMTDCSQNWVLCIVYHPQICLYQSCEMELSILCDTATLWTFMSDYKWKLSLAICDKMILANSLLKSNPLVSSSICKCMCVHHSYEKENSR